MPSVAEELAALKQRSLTKQFSTKLKDADGLSTPEQEAANLQKTSKTNRASVYKKEAVQKLNAGTKAVDQDLAFKQKQIAQKKEDMQKKNEAAKNLKSFNTASNVDQDLAFKQKQIAQKKEDMQKKEDAAKNLKSFNTAKVAAAANGSSSKQTAAAPPPAPAKAPELAADEEVVADDTELGDMPVLEEVEEVPDLVPDSTVVPELTGSTSSDWAPPTPVPPKRVPNRAEKKAKKTVEKLGLKGVAGIARVTLKLGGSQGFYTIFQPDVYVSKTGTYVIFGEAQQGAGGAMEQQAQAARAAKMLDTPVPTPSAAAATTTTDGAAAATGDSAESPLDETGLEAKDIDLVMSQAGCSRNKAVTALRENNGDLVNAIMSLTT